MKHFRAKPVLSKDVNYSTMVRYMARVKNAARDLKREVTQS